MCVARRIPDGIDQESVSGNGIHIVCTGRKEMPFLRRRPISLRILPQDLGRIISRIYRDGIKVYHPIGGKTFSDAVHFIVYVFAEGRASGIEKIDYPYGSIVSQHRDKHS